jgi:hypothetical protein
MLNNKEKLLFIKIVFNNINKGASKIKLPYGRLEYQAPNKFRDWHHLYLPIRCGGVQSVGCSLFDCLVKLCRIILNKNKSGELPWIGSSELLNSQIIEAFKMFRFYNTKLVSGR